MSEEIDYDYFEIKIPSTKSNLVTTEDFMLSLGACSVTYRDADDVPILEPLPGQTPLWNNILVTAMFTKDFNEEKIVQAARNKFNNHQIISERLKNQIWERTWLEHFKPMCFGDNTWIIPSEFDAVDIDAINIYLDPGLAFGTGTHATTSLCLQWLDAYNVQGKTAIDFGCGSGILAIAALKHGAKKVYCTDIDPQAIESTCLNAKTNKVYDGIEIIKANEISALKNLDIILANILAAPLMSLVHTFYDLLSDEGELIMSGILAEQTDEIVAKFSPSFVDFQINIEDDWASVCARKKPSIKKG